MTLSCLPRCLGVQGVVLLSAGNLRHQIACLSNFISRKIRSASIKS